MGVANGQDDSSGFSAEVLAVTKTEMPPKGLNELVEVAQIWADESMFSDGAPLSTNIEERVQKCTKIYEGLAKATEDNPHDLFNGLRVFGTTFRKATDKV